MNNIKASNVKFRSSHKFISRKENILNELNISRWIGDGEENRRH